MFTTPTDDQEHSIELQLSFLSYIQHKLNITLQLVPILVGSLNDANEYQYGKLLSTYVSDNTNFFILSSDFCHWGQRFNYTYIDAPHLNLPIYQSIEHCDKSAMACISESVQKNDIAIWYNYLNTTHNTICGRHPISVYLNSIIYNQLINNINSSTDKCNIIFVAYTQSSHCQSKHDSSVSYGAGVCMQCNENIPYDTNQLAVPSVPANQDE